MLDLRSTYARRMLDVCSCCSNCADAGTVDCSNVEDDNECCKCGDGDISARLKLLVANTVLVCEPENVQGLGLLVRNAQDPFGRCTIFVQFTLDTTQFLCSFRPCDVELKV